MTPQELAIHQRLAARAREDVAFWNGFLCAIPVALCIWAVLAAAVYLAVTAF